MRLYLSCACAFLLYNYKGTVCYFEFTAHFPVVSWRRRSKQTANQHDGYLKRKHCKCDLRFRLSHSARIRNGLISHVGF